MDPRWEWHDMWFWKRKIPPSPAWDELAAYNAERARGVEHGPGQDAYMARIQKDYDGWFAGVTCSHGCRDCAAGVCNGGCGHWCRDGEMATTGRP